MKNAERHANGYGAAPGKSIKDKPELIKGRVPSEIS
jgi:hypothetical protein